MELPSGFDGLVDEIQTDLLHHQYFAEAGRKKLNEITGYKRGLWAIPSGEPSEQLQSTARIIADALAERATPEQIEAWIQRQLLGVRLDSRMVRLLAWLHKQAPQVFEKMSQAGVLTDEYEIPREDIDRAKLSSIVNRWRDGLPDKLQPQAYALLSLILCDHCEVVLSKQSCRVVSVPPPLTVAN